GGWLARRLPRLGGGAHGDRAAPRRPREPGRDRRALRPRLPHAGGAPGGRRRRGAPLPADRVRAGRARRPQPPGEGEADRVRDRVRGRGGGARASGRAARRLGGGADLVRRLLRLAALAWVVRWAAQEMASPLLRRRVAADQKMSER